MNQELINISVLETDCDFTKKIIIKARTFSMEFDAMASICSMRFLLRCTRNETAEITPKEIGQYKTLNKAIGAALLYTYKELA
jgi:hypothetical protein